MSELQFLYDDIENTVTRFVTFMGRNQRFDIAITKTEKYYGKVLVLNLQSNRFAIIGRDDLEEPGYLEHVYNLNEEDADDLRSFLNDIVY